jgi:hypothetical protein
MKTLTTLASFLLVLSIAASAMIPAQNPFLTLNVSEGIMLKAKKSGRNFIPVVTLPEIQIQANRTTKKTETAILIHELPVVNIVGERKFVCGHLIRVISNGEICLPTIELPEITINSNREFPQFTAPGINISATINLPEVEITASRLTAFQSLATADMNSNVNTEWFYFALKNCGIEINAPRICEVLSQTQLNPKSLLYRNFKTVFSR